MTDPHRELNSDDISGMLQSELLSEKFKQILRRIIELDDKLMQCRHQQPVQISDHQIMKILEGWYKAPSDADFRIVE